jgi:hypothetical protein
MPRLDWLEKNGRAALIDCLSFFGHIIINEIFFVDYLLNQHLKKAKATMHRDQFGNFCHIYKRV